jgi:RNA 3'-terminal phosphate cyclase
VRLPTTSIIFLFSCHSCNDFQTINVDIDVVKETSSIGVGCGLIVLAFTSTGCILAGSALGKKGVSAEGIDLFVNILNFV